MENAKNALLMRFISIPSFNKRPITLSGMPNLIRGLAIYSEIFGFFFSKKKSKNQERNNIYKKGVDFINPIFNKAILTRQGAVKKFFNFVWII